MSRTTQRARASFYRSGGVLRLGSVVMLLVIVGLLMTRAADPANWTWLTGQPNDDDRDILLVAAPATPEEVTPGPTDTDRAEIAAAEEQFQAITDNTLILGREEMPAYWRLFNWVEHQSLAELSQRANRDPVLNQFIQYPDEQRGKLFQLKLNVRQIFSYDAPANSAGVSRVYEIRGWTTESKAWLYVVLTAHLPSGMPVGADVNESVTFAGYFLKDQGYHAAGAGPKDKPLAAPLLIGRIAWNPPPQVATATNDGWTQGVIIFLALVGTIVLGVWIFIPKRAGANRSENPYAQLSTPRSEIHDWLKEAEHSSPAVQTQGADFHFHNN
ncbi:MAG TPA: hypothetical protein VGI40_04180 [Pirellulaceae bacterium]|jgi:hypothetical protein